MVTRSWGLLMKDQKRAIRSLHARPPLGSWKGTSSVISWLQNSITGCLYILKQLSRHCDRSALLFLTRRCFQAIAQVRGSVMTCLQLKKARLLAGRQSSPSQNGILCFVKPSYFLNKKKHSSWTKTKKLSSYDGSVRKQQVHKNK